MKTNTGRREIKIAGFEEENKLLFDIKKYQIKSKTKLVMRQKSI